MRLTAVAIAMPVTKSRRKHMSHRYFCPCCRSWTLSECHLDGTAVARTPIDFVPFCPEREWEHRVGTRCLGFYLSGLHTRAGCICEHSLEGSDPPSPRRQPRCSFSRQRAGPGGLPHARTICPVAENRSLHTRDMESRPDRSTAPNRTGSTAAGKAKKALHPAPATSGRARWQVPHRPLRPGRQHPRLRPSGSSQRPLTPIGSCSQVGPIIPSPSPTHLPRPRSTLQHM